MGITYTEVKRELDKSSYGCEIKKVILREYPQEETEKQSRKCSDSKARSISYIPTIFKQKINKTFLFAVILRNQYG